VQTPRGPIKVEGSASTLGEAIFVKVGDFS